MRKLVYAINISLDGCCDHTKFVPDEETMQYFTNLTKDADTFVYGRKTYELMVPYWPEVVRNTGAENDRTVDIEFALAFDAVKNRIVFSRTLENAEDEKTTIFHAGLQNEILKLKQQNGKKILTGGVNVPSQLAELGLIDEYHFVLHPIVIGTGRKLFESISLAEKLQLQLIDSKTFKSGVMALHYTRE